MVLSMYPFDINPVISCEVVKALSAMSLAIFFSDLASFLIELNILNSHRLSVSLSASAGEYVVVSVIKDIIRAISAPHMENGFTTFGPCTIHNRTY